MIRRMVDSTHYVAPVPGVTVAAFYLAGNGASRGWPSIEVDAAVNAYDGVLPIQVAYNRFTTPEGDARLAISQLHGFGIGDGAIAIDIEAGVADKARNTRYVERWTNELHKYDRYALGYTSRSTLNAVNGADGKWMADYNGRAELEGYAAHQYTNPGAYDLSVIDDLLVPIRGISHTPVPPTEGDEMVAFDSRTGGYWCVASDGGVFAYRGAPYLGGLNNHPEWHAPGNGKVVGIVPWPGDGTNGGGNGYSVIVDTGTAGTARFTSYDFPGDGRYAH